MFKAIYIGDVRYERMYIFTYNNENNKFEMYLDKSISYDAEVIIEDPDWLLFKVDGEEVIMIHDKRLDIL